MTTTFYSDRFYLSENNDLAPQDYQCDELCLPVPDYKRIESAKNTAEWDGNLSIPVAPLAWEWGEYYVDDLTVLTKRKFVAKFCNINNTVKSELIADFKRRSANGVKSMYAYRLVAGADPDDDTEGFPVAVLTIQASETTSLDQATLDAYINHLRPLLELLKDMLALRTQWKNSLNQY
ncbi:hypothetical protein [Marinobacter sp.]|uniref:hypothetical protein n=1 Tax=Marinobacter sp. TaxID=50741 RepID=UPI003A9562DB